VYGIRLDRSWLNLETSAEGVDELFCGLRQVARANARGENDHPCGSRAQWLTSQESVSSEQFDGTSIRAQATDLVSDQLVTVITEDSAEQHGVGAGCGDLLEPVCVPVADSSHC
jgi:hypothetical protein